MNRIYHFIIGYNKQKMPTRDGSYFSVINKLQSRTAYVSHLANQTALNEGKAARVNSNGKSGSIASMHGMGSAGFTKEELFAVFPKLNPIPTIVSQPTKPASLTSSAVTSSSFVISWTGGDGATSYTFTANGNAVTPSSFTSQSATFSSGINAASPYDVIVTAKNAGGDTSSEPFRVTTFLD